MAGGAAGGTLRSTCLINKLSWVLQAYQSVCGVERRRVVARIFEHLNNKVVSSNHEKFLESLRVYSTLQPCVKCIHALSLISS